MKLNKELNSEEQKQQKLRRISYREKAVKAVKVYAPSGLETEDGDQILTGFNSDQPVSFNITGYYPAMQNAGSEHNPPVQHPGEDIIGVFIAKKTSGDIMRNTGNTVSELVVQQPGVFTGYVQQIFSSIGEIKAKSFISGFYEQDQIRFFYYNDGVFHPCKEFYTLSLDVFSRNSGILESKMMKSMTAIISGCGSVGSYVALELARSGVGRFLLIDHDVLSYSNICRHQCGISDVGRYKTLAIADRIRLINPEAEIGIQNSVVENVLPETFDNFCGPDSIIVGCADNRQGDLYTCKIAAHYNMPMVSIGFWERAFAGEVFYWIPDHPDLACYQCFTKALGDISGRQNVNRRFYTTETDLSKVNFMPGISVDINFVTNIGVKILLDIFNRNNKDFIPRLLDSLTQFTLIANTQKEEIGGVQAAIFSYPLQVTTSIEVEKMADCRICNKKVK